VLILLHERGGEVALPLIRRTVLHGDVHSAQVALPGGGRQQGESEVDTALRETREELGIDLKGIQLLGSLSPHWIPVSGYLVAPFVAVIDQLGAVNPDPIEVEELLLTSVERLEDSSSRSSFVHPRGGTAAIPCWRLDEDILWGATAMILAELLALMRDSRSTS
jgi:8-oxo-dGTP pyrophosphatase MutT (NUDIX family)